MKKLFYGKDHIPTLEEFVDACDSKGIPQDEAEQYYNEQEIVQLYRTPNPKYKLYNHYAIDAANSRHECDILYMPSDRGYMYCLTLIDVASRFKAACPMRDKTAAACLRALMKIYGANTGYLADPKVLATDSGSEFKGDFSAYLKKMDITHDVTERGQHLAFIERFNGTLSKALFKKMGVIELDTKKISRKWIDALDEVVAGMNASKTRLIGMTPIEAMILAQDSQPIPQAENSHSKKDAAMEWPIGTVVRFLYEPDEIAVLDSGKVKTDRRRLTDVRWSLGKYTVSAVSNGCATCIKYHSIEPLEGDAKAKPTDRTFNYWSLQQVPA